MKFRHHMQLFLQPTARMKSSRKSLQDLLAMHQRPWSRDCLHFSNKLIKQCRVLKPFLNPHWYFECILSKNPKVGYTSIFQNFGKVGNMLIGL